VTGTAFGLDSGTVPPESLELSEQLIKAKRPSTKSIKK
jgi:hypothetical protein